MSKELINNIHNGLIISAIFPSFLLLILDLYSIFLIIGGGFKVETFIFLTVCFLGIIGFYGLYKLYFDRFNKKLIQTILLLVSGVISCFITSVYLELEFKFILLKSFRSTIDFIFSFIIFWPSLIAIFYITLLSIKVIQSK